MHGTAQDVGVSFSPSSAQAVPLVFEQPQAGPERLFLAIVVGLILGALLTPFWLIGARLAADPAARAIVAGDPALGLQLGLGLAILLAMFGWPLASLARGALLKGRITIDKGVVYGVERGIFGVRDWIEPLAAYSGVRHRVRSSLSGVRHEIWLVHPQHRRCVLLATAPRISDDAVADAARLFGLAEIPSREAVSFASERGFQPYAEPQPRLAEARI